LIQLPNHSYRREGPESRYNLQLTGSDLSSDDDSDYETPKKQHKPDFEFVLDTLNRRGQAKFPGLSNGAVVGPTSQFQAFVESSKCATTRCKELLKPVTIDLAGLGTSPFNSRTSI